MATNTSKRFPKDQQYNARAHAVWFDQHRDSKFTNAEGARIFEYGRPWWSVVEKSTGQPVGPVYPMGWDAPFTVPMQYINQSIGRIARPELGNLPVPFGTNSDRFRIDYTQMQADDRWAKNEHFRRAVQIAASKNLPIPTFSTVMDSRVLELVGPLPRDPRIAEACMGGNKWILGQLMPTLDRVTGQMRVEEDVELARLLRMGNAALWTPEESEREALRLAQEQAEREERGRTVELPPEFKQLLADTLAMKAELAAMKAEKAPKNKGGRPKKEPTVAQG